MSEAAGIPRFSKICLLIGFFFLYAPMVVLIVYSFNDSDRVNIWGGFSNRWYGELFRDEAMMSALWMSLRLAFASATASVVLGMLAALVLTRVRNFRSKTLFGGMVTAPLVMPEIITGITQLLLLITLFRFIGWPHRGFGTIVLAHVTFCTAYVTVTVQSRLVSVDRSLEEAAMDLGAGPFGAFMDTTLPIIAPALATSWLLSLTLSLDDLVISSFVSGPGASTLPMLVYSQVKLGVSPDVNALATLIVTVVGSGVVVAGWLMQRAERQRALDRQLADRG